MVRAKALAIGSGAGWSTGYRYGYHHIGRTYWRAGIQRAARSTTMKVTTEYRLELVRQSSVGERIERSVVITMPFGIYGAALLHGALGEEFNQRPVECESDEHFKALDGFASEALRQLGGEC
jgi:hypothetical protein